MDIRKRLLYMILLMLVSSASAAFHEFYVSLTEIRFNGHSGIVEISMRLFPDDLDKALLQKFGISTNLATEIEHAKADSLLEIYVASHFNIQVDGNMLPVEYLGKEADGNAIWCFLESSYIGPTAKITVRNSILTETFDSQVNIIQVYFKEMNKGLLLNRQNPEDPVEF